VARSLVTRQTATIGVIVAEIDTPLFLQALNVIEPIARNANHNILLCTTASNLSDERQVIDLLLEKQVDGIIYLSTSVCLNQNPLVDLPSDAPPIVLINRTIPYEARFDQISFDNINGIITAMAYLVQLGHRRIAHLSGPRERNSSEERLQGYRLGLYQYGLEYREDYVRLADYEQPQATWEQATLELLELSPMPTAIICANDIVAATAMRTAQRAGLRVPQDISIIGVDNQPFCTYLNPALTTVQLPILESGKRATEILLARIVGIRTMTEHLILPCPLVVRESTGLVALAEIG
jgi:LacI family repressor for deo operon, udp, cdd, tsx, nupC, and nupG